MRLLKRPMRRPFSWRRVVDRYAVESADLVSQRWTGRILLGKSIEHTPYQNLGDVATHVNRWLAGRVFLREETQDRVSGEETYSKIMSTAINELELLTPPWMSNTCLTRAQVSAHPWWVLIARVR